MDWVFLFVVSLKMEKLKQYIQLRCGIHAPDKRNKIADCDAMRTRTDQCYRPPLL